MTSCMMTAYDDRMYDNLVYADLVYDNLVYDDLVTSCMPTLTTRRTYGSGRRRSSELLRRTSSCEPRSAAPRSSRLSRRILSPTNRHPPCPLVSSIQTMSRRTTRHREVSVRQSHRHCRYERGTVSLYKMSVSASFSLHPAEIFV